MVPPTLGKTFAVTAVLAIALAPAWGCIVPAGRSAAGSPGALAEGTGSGEKAVVLLTSPTSGLPVPAGPGAVPRPAATGPLGDLAILDWAGFTSAVTYTFDDANSSQIQHYRDLNGLDVRFTFYLITSKAEARDPVWKQALQDGHELGNHTKSHMHGGTAADVDAGQAFLEGTYGISVWTMVAPYGDLSYKPIATTRYLVNRGVSNGLVGTAANDPADPFNLYCYIPPTGARASAFNAQIDAARAARKWRIVLVHGFSGGSDNAYQPIDIREFAASVNHTRSLGDVWIDSMVNVASYWRGQKAVAAAQVATGANGKTWSWTLPSHFPPGKFLRVRADGGTLSQGGKPLAWDDHGYYEMALDPGSVTLSQ
jgi:peptidoglycan/xylan/chitin deacetylase (PgdA/CDA1 family)